MTHVLLSGKMPGKICTYAKIIDEIPFTLLFSSMLGQKFWIYQNKSIIYFLKISLQGQL